MIDKQCDKSNVIELPLELRPKDTANLHLVVKRREGCIGHHSPVIVDEGRRCVYCKTCKAPLDPFAELLHVANQHERYHNDLKNKATEIKGAQARLDLLKRLENNTRARLRKLGVKTTCYWFDKILDWAAEHAKKSGRSARGIDRDFLQYELEMMSPMSRLGVATKAIEDGVGLPAIEMATQVLEEMRAALETESERRPA